MVLLRFTLLNARKLREEVRRTLNRASGTVGMAGGVRKTYKPPQKLYLLNLYQKFTVIQSVQISLFG